MDWKTIDLEGINTIRNFIKNRFQTGDLSSVNLYMWRRAKKLEYLLTKDLLLIRGVEDDNPFIYPPVSESREKIVETVSAYLKRGYILRAVPPSIYEILKESFPLYEERDRFDYVYLVEDLISLKGRKYHKKKNQLNKFMNSYEFQYETIGGQNIDELVEFQKNWCEDRECHLNKGLTSEMEGIIEVLQNYDKLQVGGGLIRVEGRIAAFSIGEVITPDTVLIHIEKGSSQYVGVYQAINKMVLEHEFPSYTYVNREEDLGSESLRKAKESYHPCMLLSKYKSTSDD